MWLKSTNIAKIRVTNYLVNKVFVISLGFYNETVKKIIKYAKEKLEKN